MIFILLVLINLAAVAPISTPGPVHFEDEINNYLMTKCAPDGKYFVERFKRFKNCVKPEGKVLSYAEQASPFVCLLSLNMVIESCTERIPNLWKRVSNGSKDLLTSCPLNYTVLTNYLGSDIDLAGGARYLGDKENCFSICNYNKQFFEDCKFMGRLSDVINSHRQDLVVNTSSAGHPKPLEQNRSPNMGELHTRNETHSVGSSLYMTTSEKLTDSKVQLRPKVPVKGSVVEVPHKTDSKLQVTQTSVECETKTNNANSGSGKNNVDSKLSKDNANMNSNSVPYSNTNTSSSKKYNVSSDLGNPLLNRKSYVKELEVKETKSTPSVFNTERPLVNGDIDQPSFQGPDERVIDDSKKDFAYDSQQKLSEDDADDLDANDEIPEKAELQESLPGRDTDFPKHFHAKDLGNGDNFFQSEDSHFSTYFFMTISIIVLAYVLYRNKNKIVAYALEGRRSKNGRRRPLSASYRKLDCNLEEAIASNPSHASMTSVVY